MLSKNCVLVFKVYVVSLTLSKISNYIVDFMVCKVFLFFIFTYRYIKESLLVGTCLWKVNAFENVLEEK